MAAAATGITAEDRTFMMEALKLAEHAYDRREVPIGCLMVKGGRELVRAHNKTNEEGDPTLHAEMLAVDKYVQQIQSLIEQRDFATLNELLGPEGPERPEGRGEDCPATKREGCASSSGEDGSGASGDKASLPGPEGVWNAQNVQDVRDIPPHVLLRNVTLYVTIEPCVMCASALSSLGLKRCVFGASNPKFGGCGSILSVPSVASPPWGHFRTDHGLYAAEAVSLLQRFFARENPETRQRR